MEEEDLTEGKGVVHNGEELYKESTLMDTLGGSKVSIRLPRPIKIEVKGESVSL